ncbi:Ribosome assembly protein rrb1 [Entomophthora muscae]|uniref:Ribosome assembly protein rrb1 n=2 Tax=Entomophthora muscae TaxID=34485 RepID=A0ACC2RUD8_9FUNG|nr:Ribosome assembly protein rrb1 [Entomophthora muscae]
MNQPWRLIIPSKIRVMIAWENSKILMAMRMEEDDELEDGDEIMVDDGTGEEEKEPEYEVYIPGRALEDGEKLEIDNSTYDMYHQFSVNWPCLTFDIIPDGLGDNRTKFPMSLYLAAGTQADSAEKNQVQIMKISQLCKTIHDDDAAVEGDSDDEIDEDPILETRSLAHIGGVNRIRVHAPLPEVVLAATWSETGKVNIYNLHPSLFAMDHPGTTVPAAALQPLHIVETHGMHEGYAMDWSSLEAGKLLTGDNDRRIYLTTINDSGIFPDRVPFSGHQSSVEDLQWSPVQKNIFASCSADKTVRIWDIRAKKRAHVTFTAHNEDVNVISWNRNVSHLLASGSDDGTFSIWDLRSLKVVSSGKPAPVAHFKWHTAPITSIEWHPTDESTLAVAGADDQVTQWDLSVEQDDEDPAHAALKQANGAVVPPQLLFSHQGQTNIKEIHWHRQLPGCMVSTAESGFNIFKTISV